MNNCCPVCQRSGIISTLYSFSDASGTVSNLCSNLTCSYPFESYDDLENSISQSHLQSTQPSNILLDQDDLNLSFLESFALENEVDAAQNFRSGGQVSANLNNVNPEPPVLQQQVAKPCSILPRYLADSIREANRNHSGFSHSPGSDSGVSTVSTISNLSYAEILALRAQKRQPVNETSKPVRPVSLLEHYSRQNET